MNKTISVTIGGVIFHIEEDAYLELKKYLDEIKEYFVQHGEGDDVMPDIETSIADKFGEKLGKTKQVVTKKEVKELIEVMGSVEDFFDQEEDAPQASSMAKEREHDSNEDTIPKKLYRNPDDMVIAGVCSGLSAYFGIDPVIMRVIFAASVFAGGTGILLYLLLWMAMPEAKTTAQKLEMRGKPVTLEKLRKVTEEKITPQVKSAGSALKKVLNFPFKIIEMLFAGAKRLFCFLGPVLRWLIGLPLIFGSLLGIFVLSLLAAVLVFNLDSELIRTGFPLEELASAFPFKWAVASAWLSSVIPILFAALIGFALISRKNIFSAVLNSTLIGVWMASLIALIVISIDAAPRIEQMVDESEYKETVTRQYDFANFNSLYLKNSHQAIVRPGPDFSVLAIGSLKDLDNLDLRQKDEELVLQNRQDSGICLFCYSNNVEFEITMPELSQAVCQNASGMDISGFQGERLMLKAGGVSEISLKSDYDKYIVLQSGSSRTSIQASSSDLEAEISGASTLSIAGQGQSARIDIDDVSRFYGFKYDVQEATIRAGGAARAELNAEKIISDVGDAAKAHYIGEPEIIKTSASANVIESESRKESLDILFENEPTAQIRVRTIE